MKNNTRKKLSLGRAEKKAVQLLEAAKNSYPAIETNDIRCVQVRDYARHLSDLLEKKEELVK